MPAITKEDVVGCRAPFSISELKKQLHYAVSESWESTKEHNAKGGRLLTRNQAYEQSYRGFESHPFRHRINELRN
jgi:hypothetical protein